MFNEISYSEIKNNCIFIDVRSPGEFKEGSIPNSVNIPILDNEERKIVGTTYKQHSKNEARRLGIEFVSPKLLKMFDEVMDLKKLESYLVVYCARGGYRSTAFASIFSSIGLNLFKLADGYKGYRKYVLETLPKINEKVNYIVVHGNTGVGKTDVLMELKRLGYDVLDLEGAANHRGSLLGSIGIGECNSQKNFEANIFEQLNFTKIEKSVWNEPIDLSDYINDKKIIEGSRYVFVEAESKKIGKSVIPDYIFDKMKSGLHIFIDADLDYRAKSLKKDYVLNENWIEESAKAFELLRKYLSSEKVNYLLDMLKESNFEEVAKELMVNYYDPMYMNKANEYKYVAKFKSEVSAQRTAEEISEWMKHKILKANF